MKNILFFFFIFITISSFAQTKNETEGLKLFNRGLEFYSEGKLDSTLVLWTEIVEKGIDKAFDTYGSAFFNIPTIYWQLKKYDKAKEWYKKVLASDLKDNGETGDLMEPHANYKHKSAVALAGLYEIDSNYEQVLFWLNKADTVYRYWGFEGSATNISKTQAYLLNWETTTLLKLNKKAEAIHEIVVALICSNDLEGFFKTSEDTLLSLINKQNFKIDLDNALNTLTIQELGKNDWRATFNFHEEGYSLPIGNTYPDRDIPHYWQKHFIKEGSVIDKKTMIEYIKRRSFYTRLSE